MKPLPGHAVLAKIRHVLVTHIDAQVDYWSRERLALLTLGVIRAHSAAPARMATALHNLGVTLGTAESIERRIRRSENDPQLTAELCVHPLARHYLLFGQPQELILALDPTTQDERVVMVKVAVCYRGQSLPLVWTTWPAEVPLQGDRFWVRIAGLILQAAALLPPGVPVTWLADRAFGTPAFIDLVSRPGWHYVVRVQRGTLYRDRRGRERAVDTLVPYRGSRGKGHGLLFKKRGWRSASVVALWGQRYKDPLCVVTNLRPRWAVRRLYRRRYGIEALFRNYKTHGWQWEQGQVTDLVHVERLLVAMAVAAWLAVLVGTQVAHELLARPATGHRYTTPWVGKRSLFTLGLAGWARMLSGREPCELPDTLVDWEARSWQTQITQHHAWAFIFGPHP